MRVPSSLSSREIDTYYEDAGGEASDGFASCFAAAAAAAALVVHSSSHDSN